MRVRGPVMPGRACHGRFPGPASLYALSSPCHDQPASLPSEAIGPACGLHSGPQVRRGLPRPRSPPAAVV